MEVIHEEGFKETFELVMFLIRSVNPKFSRDGDEYCFLLGENLQEGICGFGKNAWAAACDFYKDFFLDIKQTDRECKGENNALKTN